MNILVTGGSGCIGSHLTELLVQNKHTVRVLSRNSSPSNLQYLQAFIDIIVGDIGNLDYNKLTQGIDIVYHLAWTTVPQSATNDTPFDVESNIVGGLKLLEACVKNRVKKIIFVSTGGAIYGIPKQIPIPESHPCNPLNAYGLSKHTFERYLQLYHKLYGLSFISLRVANAYGERQNINNKQGVINTWLTYILNNKAIEIWGDGEVIRDYIYVKDIASALIASLGLQNSTGIYNIGTGIGTSLNEIITLIKQITHQNFTVNYKEARKIDVPISILDIQSFTHETGWIPATSLKQGVRNTYAYLSNQFME